MGEKPFMGRRGAMRSAFAAAVLAMALACASIGLGAMVRAAVVSADGEGICCSAVAYAATPSGLVKENGFYRYYSKGTVITSTWKRVNGYTYYFNSQGNAIAGKSAKIGDYYWIFSNYGRLLKPSANKIYTLNGGMFYVSPKGHPAAKGYFIRDGKLYYASTGGKLLRSTSKDGITFTSTAAAKSNTASQLKIQVMKKLKSLTTSSMTKRQKLRACFNYCVSQPFDNSMEPTDIGKSGWMQRCALKALQTNRSECFGCACTFAAFAYELGYDPYVKGLRYYHAFVLIDGKAYDNMYPGFGGTPQKMPSGTKTWHFTAWGPSASTASATAIKAGTTKTGLVKKGEDYYYVKSDGTYAVSCWKTIGDYRYCFRKTGKAVIGTIYLSNKYYIFGENARLSTGTKVHLITVKGITYRVNADGTALPGFSADKTKYYLPNGALMKSTRVIKGLFYSSSTSGVYLPERTAALRAAAGPSTCSDFSQAKEAAPLLKLLGTPISRTETGSSCHPFTFDIGGQDVKYEFYKKTVWTFLADDGVEYIESYS